MAAAGTVKAAMTEAGLIGVRWGKRMLVTTGGSLEIADKQISTQDALRAEEEQQAVRALQQKAASAAAITTDNCLTSNA